MLFSKGYAQVGLTDMASAGYIGHAVVSSVVLPTNSGTGAASVSFNGTSLYGNASKGYNLVSGLSNNGIAAGVALRFDAAANADLPTGTSLGQDAWVNTTNVSPVALNAANTASVSFYQPNAPNSVGPHNVPTVPTATPGLPPSSTYVNANQSLSTIMNPGTSNMTVLGMNSTGLTVGSITRTDNGLNIGNDLWVYDPSLQHEFILAAPATAGNYGAISYQGISDTGVVRGSYITNATGTATSTTGNYLFDWSEATGFTTLDQLYSGTATSPTYMSLNNALAGQTNAADLFPSGLSNIYMFTDAAGDSFIDGNTTSLNGISNGAFEISAVPEPTSATLVLLGATSLLSRRRRRMA
jgi:hypothetical protein